ncbi:hypothetical protein [Bradyrhizobium australiense]|uniref:Secreted protein n=1 Tax=Bradyrhizobium australiense TaxID=2721161 RepID=A0A7Y4LVX1_9BRAD|nr:hypothetical protein [Bradyrhizobium australiense]NOJ40798.1 hypothetical protein [Bradyrhizobium australiense]
MTYRTTFIASLSAVALVLAASAASADPGVAPARPAFPAFPKSGHHHHHRGVSGFWPAGGVVYGLPSDVDRPLVVETPPLKTSDDIRFTCVYDIPWDYVHRCPQFNTPRQ